MRNKNGHGGNTQLINLDDINVPQRTIDRIMRKDHAQIERMRQEFESDCEMVRVVLRPRCGGGYDIEDGRHRVIAAKLADQGFIEALVVGE